MKGFGIEIKNNLLDPKHVDNMSSSVWFYMWLVDHITLINLKGEGIVLGGKPVKYEEVLKDLGMSRDTYTRWIEKLEIYPYIETTRTPYGIKFKVFKAHKRFKNRIRENAESTSEVMRNPLRENAESNKTVTVDSNSKTISEPKARNVDKSVDKEGKLSFPKEWYLKVEKAYREIKKVQPLGKEWGPIQREEKMMFESGRTVEQIIKSMEVCNSNYTDWSMSTVRMKIADVVAGKLFNKSSGIVMENWTQKRIAEEDKNYEGLDRMNQLKQKFPIGK